MIIKVILLFGEKEGYKLFSWRGFGCEFFVCGLLCFLDSKLKSFEGLWYF
jgi:hypothetical protein